jgi:hypothetical protein
VPTTRERQGLWLGFCQALIACQPSPGAEPTRSWWIGVVPFISQIAACPLVVFWKRMSEKPSPLKSPVPIAFQFAPGLRLRVVWAIGVVPFISQIATCPFVFCNRMSESPSPLKSPVPTAFQFGPGLGAARGVRPRRLLSARRGRRPARAAEKPAALGVARLRTALFHGQRIIALAAHGALPALRLSRRTVSRIYDLCCRERSRRMTKREASFVDL